MLFKKIFILYLLIEVLLITTSVGKCASIILEEDPGYLRNKSDAQSFNAALKKLGNAEYDTLIIPKGDYTIQRPKKGAHIKLSNLKGKRIIGNNSLISFKYPYSGGISISNCNDLIFEGFKIKWELPPFLEGKIRKVDSGKKTVEIEVSANGKVPLASYFSNVDKIWGTLYNKNGERLCSISRRVIKVSDVKEMSERKYLLKLRNQLDFINPDLKIGNLFVVVGRKLKAHGLSVEDCKRITVKNIDIFTSPAMGILVHEKCTDISIRDCAIRPAEGKLISSNADGIHVIDPLGKLNIEGNLMIGVQDDAVVVSRRGCWGTYDDDLKTILLKGNKRTLPIGKDIFVEILLPRGGLEYIGKPLSYELIKHSICQIGIEKKIGKQYEGLLFPVFWKSGDDADVLISNNRIENSRRGIRVNYPGVAIVSNCAKDIAGPTVMLGPLVGNKWVPQYPAINVKIKDNKFFRFKVRESKRPKFGIINLNIYPNEKSAEFGTVNFDVLIENNKFYGDIPKSIRAVVIGNANGVRILGNSIEGKSSTSFPIGQKDISIYNSSNIVIH